MRLLRSLGQDWSRLRQAARDEFLRDPDVVLFERRAQTVPPLTRESARGR